MVGRASFYVVKKYKRTNRMSNCTMLVVDMTGKQKTHLTGGDGSAEWMHDVFALEYVCRCFLTSFISVRFHCDMQILLLIWVVMALQVTLTSV